MDTFYEPSVSILSGFECVDNMNYTAIYWVSCFTNSQKVKKIMKLVSTKKNSKTALNSANTDSVTLDYTRATLK